MAPAQNSVTDRAFQALPCLCLFLAYPVALVCPVRLGRVLAAARTRLPPLASILPADFDFPITFHLALPVTLWLSCLATGYLAVTPIRTVRGRCRPWHRSAHLLVLLIAFMVAASAKLGGTRFVGDALVLLGFFTVLLFYALCPRKLLPRRMPQWLALLWCVHMLHCVWQWQVGFEIVGMAGNRNWMSTTVVALCPWCWVALPRTLRPIKGRMALPSVPALCALLIPLVLSLVVAFAGRSRGTWLALGAYCVFFVGMRCVARRWRGLFCCCLIVLMAVAGWFGRASVASAARRDIRLPLYGRTLRLIADHPLLGVGPGNFGRAFVTYRSLEHKKRRLAAHMTAHPHNEILHLAAQLGIPLGCLWCLCLLCLVRLPSTPLLGAAHFSAWMIVVHAQFDKVLVQPPTALLGLILLGILWRRHIPCRAQGAHRTPLLRCLASTVAVAVTGYGLVAGMMAVQVGWCLRKAFLAEDTGRRLADEADTQGAAKLFQYAYEAYRRTTQLRPNDVWTHTLAGTIANDKLRNPEVALSHLRRAHQLDPNFAHVNGEIAFAFGALRRHDLAYPFFRREVELYPFDVLASQRLLVCGLATGHESEVAPVSDRLGMLRERHLRHQLGAEWLARTGQAVGAALRSGDCARAAELANQLVAPLGQGSAEPAFFHLAPNADLNLDLYRKPFTADDAGGWLLAIEAHRAAEQAGGLASFAKALVTTPVSSVLGKKMRGGHFESLSHPPNEEAELVARHLVLTAAAIQDNATVAWVRSAGGALTGAIEVVAPGRQFVASLRTGKVSLDVSLREVLPASGLRSELGIPHSGSGSVQITIPASPGQFSSRAQGLGQLLSELEVASTPRLGWSPSLVLWRTTRRLGILLAAQAVPDPDPAAAPLPTPLATIGFDPLPFERTSAKLSTAPR